MSCTPASHTTNRRPSTSPSGNAPPTSARTRSGTQPSHNSPATAALSCMWHHNGSHPSPSTSCFAHTLRATADNRDRRSNPPATRPPHFALYDSGR
ncbi:hypothetical protein Kpho01_73110 [Kitasatospora phosalacinea]|uniref:Uncharacterized protein n=1 Tax=Kitasatospora phosalacinea TaxID=2065 RepID=A0A9W6PQI2_9ACTN|nr:hypothetical protein Kpho01_73110 [Kitasatospora phosalacinea]